MRSTLPAEVSAFLLEHGPSTSTVIALGVRARRGDVDEVLASGPFVEAPAPEGGHPHARHWVDPSVASALVPARPGGQGRAAAMLAVLSDGRKHSRAEIFKASGKFFLTNNAAAQLRAQGHDIRSECLPGHVYVYWLESTRASATLSARRGPSVSKPHSAVAA